MSDRNESAAGPEIGSEPPERPERAGEALRRAVERTLGATTEGAASTRQRAGDLLDEVTRLGLAAREEVSRRGEAARDEVSRRGEEASTRLAEAIAELRHADRDDLAERVAALEARIGALEREIGAHETLSNPHVEAEKSWDEPHERGQQGKPGA